MNFLVTTIYVMLNTVKHLAATFNFPCVGLENLYAIAPGRCGYILRGLSYGIGIEVNGYNMSLATLGCHESYEACTCAHIKDMVAMLYPSPCPE